MMRKTLTTTWPPTLARQLLKSRLESFEYSLSAVKQNALMLVEKYDIPEHDPEKSFAATWAIGTAVSRDRSVLIRMMSNE